ncbi:MAG: Fpg/Nei family DNA glycosylase [Candidatus Eisenbacteria bacterium]
MPELPDIVVYIESLEARIAGGPLLGVRLRHPFVLRSFDPPIEEAVGRPVGPLRRLGKRIVLPLPPDLFLVVHLMIAGRLRWLPPGAAIPGRLGLAALDFPAGTLVLTEAGTQKRAWIRLVRGEEGLADLDPGGLEVLDSDLASFRSALLAENRTLKRALTDPRLFSGIGNAYSDEILHRARLSPVRLTEQLTAAEIARLREGCLAVLTEWTERLRQEAAAAGGFPKEVTAFRKEMAAHGRYGLPCPVCGTPIQRIVYAANETNYCPGCQTGGRLLADRALSRLLKKDWPRTLEELEELRGERDGGGTRGERGGGGTRGERGGGGERGAGGERGEGGERGAGEAPPRTRRP